MAAETRPPEVSEDTELDIQYPGPFSKDMYRTGSGAYMDEDGMLISEAEAIKAANWANKVYARRNHDVRAD